MPYGGSFQPMTANELVVGSPELGRPELTTSPARVAPPVPSKALEYELVDLLKLDGIGEPESEAIWTLVRFLTAKKKDA